MRRLLFAAVVGVCSLGSLQAQEGALAPTVPVVPSPVIQDGRLLNPTGGRGSWGVSSGPRLFALTRWSSGRNFSGAPITEPVVLPAAPPVAYSQPLPPLPAGVGGSDGSCGTGNCGPAGRGRDGVCWDRFKAWLCYAPSKSDLPKFKPTPYVTPLQGMFPCTPGAYGCAPCANGQCGPNGHYPGGQPMPLPGSGNPLPPPMQMPSGTSAGAVLMPPRGAQGGIPTPTYQGKAAASVDAGIPGFRFANPESRSATKSPAAVAPVQNTAAKVTEK